MSRVQRHLSLALLALALSACAGSGRPAHPGAGMGATNSTNLKNASINAIAIANATTNTANATTTTTTAIPPTAGQQVAQSRTVQVALQAQLRYWLFLPSGYGADTSQHWPLLVFLHGSGERGDTLLPVKAHGPPKFLDQRPDFPFIVVSPQAPADGAWDPHLLHGLLQQLLAELRVDANRVGATGLSMGGRGVWAWALDYPQDLAAIAPISGEGDEDRMARIPHLPVWAFHGEADTVVPIEAHRRSIQALRQAGGQPRFTVYPGLGHSAWEPAYADPALMDWLLAQHRAPAAPLLRPARHSAATNHCRCIPPTSTAAAATNTAESAPDHCPRACSRPGSTISIQ